MKSFFSALLMLLSVGSANADVMVLIHGYLGSGADWHKAGISHELVKAGWGYGGHLAPSNNTMALRAGRGATAENAFYTVDLPSDASLKNQSQWLDVALQALRLSRPDDRLILVGHSAGGVVARLSLVQKPDKHFSTLITIASPHLGTGTAEVGLAVARSPLGFVTPMMGLSEVNRGQGLFADLVRPRPGTALYWLNRQAHPKGRYASVIRMDQQGRDNDSIVSAYSQDMNNVAALRGRSERVRSGSGHSLHRYDASLILMLLAR